jgi:hypothetical protein
MRNIIKKKKCLLFKHEKNARIDEEHNSKEKMFTFQT